MADKEEAKDPYEVLYKGGYIPEKTSFKELLNIILGPSYSGQVDAFRQTAYDEYGDKLWSIVGDITIKVSDLIVPLEDGFYGSPINELGELLTENTLNIESIGDDDFAGDVPAYREIIVSDADGDTMAHFIVDEDPWLMGRRFNEHGADLGKISKFMEEYDDDSSSDEFYGRSPLHMPDGTQIVIDQREDFKNRFDDTFRTHAKNLRPSESLDVSGTGSRQSRRNAFEKFEGLVDRAEPMRVLWERVVVEAVQEELDTETKYDKLEREARQEFDDQLKRALGAAGELDLGQTSLHDTPALRRFMRKNPPDRVASEVLRLQKEQEEEGKRMWERQRDALRLQQAGPGQRTLNLDEWKKSSGAEEWGGAGAMPPAEDPPDRDTGSGEPSAKRHRAEAQFTLGEIHSALSETGGDVRAAAQLLHSLAF
jgi:hypothetical protein